MFRSVKLLIAMLCIGTVALGGCFSQATNKPGTTKPIVAVAIVPQAAWVKTIAGDLVEIVTMVPPGKSAETYTPTPQQMVQFSKASIYFSLLVPAETAGILPKAAELNPNLKIVDVAAAVRAVYPERVMSEHSHHDHDHDHDGHDHGDDDDVHHEGRDPHIWLSPRRAMVMVTTMATELAALDPANAAVYHANASTYVDQLKQLDQSLEQQFKQTPNKTFMIYHPALGYLADDYGLTMVALESRGKEASPQELQAAIKKARQAGIKTILYQEEMDSRQADLFAREIGGTVKKIQPLAADYIGSIQEIAHALTNGATL